MSVNYRTVILKGWQTTVKLKDTFNKMTGYRYEDNFYRPNCYKEETPDDVVFFGDVIESFDAGTWVNACDYHGMGLAPDLIFVDDGICDNSMVIYLTAQASHETEICDMLQEPPQIYIISQVT